MPIIFGFLSLRIGRYQVDLLVQFKILLSHVFEVEQTWSQMEETVVMNIRLPRILLAMLIGCYIT
ncbi:iron chelate uptake ABC transporter family permease subunit [Solibacillus sp. R5-41]|uniref:iron chelate uptake ABC transporter family permease subunit n=1 Tax=Solibacillus sp. R5-41 TaxID=2048654 RepID=UPI0021104E7C|nr:iron chelate uptake ABC transporter family permease subunit [Solibacillus sp. R5-41]